MGGAARYFCTPSCLEQGGEIVRRAASCDLPYKVLGGGANVLVRDDGFDGLVIHLPAATFGKVQHRRGRLRVGSAAALPDIVRRTVAMGLEGLECLAGIPGTVGGAVCMNAGGRFGEVGPRVASVSLLDRRGRLQEWDRRRLHFEYRGSNLTDTIILDVAFELQPVDRQALAHHYREIWEYKKRTQPFARNNAGCVFKNPTGHHAGQLVDRAGLKGLRRGGAVVSRQHANFIVTEPGATTRDILTLIGEIRCRVYEQFKVNLELEVDVW